MTCGDQKKLQPRLLFWWALIACVHIGSLLHDSGGCGRIPKGAGPKPLSSFRRQDLYLLIFTRCSGARCCALHDFQTVSNYAASRTSATTSFGLGFTATR